MHELLRYSIPLMALSIPLVAVVGKVIVRPIIDAMSRNTELERSAQSAISKEDLHQLEARMERLERSLRRMSEEQDFMRQLHGPPSPPPLRPASGHGTPTGPALEP